jgi:AraC-like DNA-binding protein
VRRFPPPPLDGVVPHLGAFYEHPLTYDGGVFSAAGGAVVFFDRGAPLWLLGDTLGVGGPGGGVRGLRTRPITIVIEAPVVRMVGVRLRPFGVAAALSAPAVQIADAVADLRHFWRGSDEVLERLAAAADGHARLDVLERELLQRIAPARLPPPAFAAVVHELARRPDAWSIDVLRERLGISHKHLTRLFRAHVGLLPKQFQRVCRFRRLLGALAGADGPDWAQLAAAGGYFDQAHLCTEFREFTGVTPSRYAPPPVVTPAYLPWSGRESMLRRSTPTKTANARGPTG